MAIGTVAIAATVFGVLAGLSPRDWGLWYAVPAVFVALGLLAGKRAYAWSRKGSRFNSIALGIASALLVVLGSWVALEHYAATPVDLGGHSL